MKCPKCGSSRLTDNGNGKKCINCDFEWIPKKTGCGTWVVLLLIIFLGVPYFVGRNSLESYDDYTNRVQQQIQKEKAESVQRIMDEAENGTNNNERNTNLPKSSDGSTKKIDKQSESDKKLNSESASNSKSKSNIESFGVWSVSAEEDEFNGSKNVYFGNKSLDYFIGHFEQKKYPVMWVRCKDNKTDVIINFDTTMTCFDGKKIGLKFDNDKPYYEYWTASTSCDALFARNPVNLLKKMANKNKLIVKFTPFQRGDINVSFDLTGIDKVKDKISGVCHWKK